MLLNLVRVYKEIMTSCLYINIVNNRMEKGI